MIYRLFLVFVLALAGYSFNAFVPQGAEAAYSPRGKCFRALKSWRAKPGFSAFAVSRSGRSCGYSSGYPSRKAANRAAARKCRQLTRGCRIIRTRKGAPSAAGGRLRGACLRNYRTWKTQDSFGAFALARNGTFCNSVWNASSVTQAKQRALAGCKASKRCTVFAVNQPSNLKKIRQTQLQTLGLYTGKIDGKWGPATRRAMRNFVRGAAHSKTDDERAWDLLRWATQIKRGYDVDVRTAIAQAERAADARSTDFMIAFAKQIGPAPAQPQSSDEDAPPSKLADLPEQQPEQREDPSIVLEQPEPEPVKKTPPPALVAGNLRKAMGLTSAKHWPHGKGAWVVNTTSRATNGRQAMGRCRLTTGGLMFAFFEDRAIGTILLTHAPLFVRNDGQAGFVFKDNSVMDQKVSTRPEIGNFIKIQNPSALIKTFAKEGWFSVRGSNGGETFNTEKLVGKIDTFNACVHQVLLEPRPPQAQQPAKSLQKKDPVKQQAKRKSDDPKTVVAKRGGSGQFVFFTEVVGLPVLMLFDTGATYVTIQESVARRIGITPTAADYKFKANTANGIAKFAKTTLKEMRVGTLVLKDVEVAVMKDKSLTGKALLGMSFLKRLKRFEFEGENLTLSQ